VYKGERKSSYNKKKPYKNMTYAAKETVPAIILNAAKETVPAIILISCLDLSSYLVVIYFQSELKLAKETCRRKEIKFKVIPWYCIAHPYCARF